MGVFGTIFPHSEVGATSVGGGGVNSNEVGGAVHARSPGITDRPSQQINAAFWSGVPLIIIVEIMFRHCTPSIVYTVSCMYKSVVL